MIKFANQVPSVYPSASRDFQYLCWLIDIVLNSVKHNVDDIYSLPESVSDRQLTELLATTLGFKVKRNYDQAQLRAIAIVLPRIMKYKGTKTAIDIAGQALLAASGASSKYKSEIRDDCELYVTFPETLVDISLFNDLLVYILPAGMTCHIERTERGDASLKTSFDYDEILNAQWQPDISWDDSTKTVTGLSRLFDVPGTETTIANFKNDNNVNIGLLDNNVIPALTNGPIVYHPEQLSELDYTEDQNSYGTTVIVNKYTSEADSDNDNTVIIGGK